MDLREAILEEHSKRNNLRIANYIGNDKKRFKELMLLFLGNEYRVTQRGSAVVSECAERHPELITPWIVKMTANLERTDIHDAVKRNTLRIFQSVELPEKVQGKLFDLSMQFLLSANEPIAVKAFAVFVLYNISCIHPELQQELKMVLTDLARHATEPALVHRYKKVLKMLEKN